MDVCKLRVKTLEAKVIVLLILALGALPSRSQTTCSAPSSILTSDDDISMVSSKPSDCRTITGHLVFGYQNCSTPCTLTSLARLDNVENIEGSITIQCCHQLTSLSLFPSITSFTGVLKIYYNRELTTIGGLGRLQSLEGSIEISQNSKLTMVNGFSSLRTITGYLAIQYNPVLTGLSGFSQLSSIGGQELLSGHAFTLLYNINLMNLAGLLSLQSISYGTVHIEGNTALCYAGYPVWSVGSYGSRLDESVSGIDRGIDWRTKLSAIEQWQYTWNVQDGGYPTLYILNNAPQGSCESATCHASCPVNAGCLGPSDTSLCGSCSTVADNVNPCVSGTHATTAPTGGSTSTNVGVVVGVVIALIVVIAVLAVLAIVMFILCRRKLGRDKTGTFDIVTYSGEEGGNNSSSYMLPSHKSSDLIASINSDHNGFGKKKNQQNMENVVTISSYKKADSFDGPADVISNKHVQSTPSPRGLSRHARPKIGQKPTSSTENLLSSDGHDNSNSDLPDMGYEQKEQKEEDHEVSPPKELEQEHEHLKEQKSSRENAVKTVEKGNVVINTNFPKEQVKLGKQIGVGDFGKVLQAEARKLIPGQKKTSIVVKQLKHNATKEEKEEFLRPVEAMKLLQHPNVLSLLGVVTSGPNILVMLEDCSNGNLKTYLIFRRRDKTNFKRSGQMLRMSKDLAAGLGYLHTMSIAHNDLGLRNCLVTKDGVVKLGDYGISRNLFKEDYYSRNPNEKGWPIRWMAPELVIYEDRSTLDSNPVTMSANIWSFGVMLWELCSFAQWPYDEMSNEEVIQMVVRTGKCSLECPFDAAEDLMFLYACCQLCWQDDGNRPTIEEIITMLEEPSSIKNKRRKSSLTRQHLVTAPPQVRSKTLPANTIPHASLQGSSNTRNGPPNRNSLVTAKMVPVSGEKLKKAATTEGRSASNNGKSTPVLKPATSTNSPSLNKPLPNSTSVQPSDDTSKPSGSPSQDSNTGTLRKPKRPAPTKPAPTKPAPTRPAPTRPAPGKDHQVKRDSKADPKEQPSKSAQPGARGSAPLRSAPHNPKSKQDSVHPQSLQPANAENIKAESSNTVTVKRVHSYRSNRKADEIAKLRRSKEVDETTNTSSAQDKGSAENNKSIPAPQATPPVPSAQNIGFMDTKNETEGNDTHSPKDDFFDSDIDETYFLGGAESLPQEDFILDPPEHFSESSVGELEEEPAAVKQDTNKPASDASSKTKTIIQSDSGGMMLQFHPPAVSDEEQETTFGAELVEHPKEIQPQTMEDSKAMEDESVKAKKPKKKKKKKKVSKEAEGSEDALKVKVKKKKKAAKQPEYEQEDEVEESLPEYLHDRGLDRIPVRASQEGAAAPPLNSISSYRSNESLDTDGNSQSSRKRHKFYYGDVKATDEFTPPWLEDDDPNEGKDDEDPYPGDDEPPNVVYDEELSSLLW